MTESGNISDFIADYLNLLRRPLAGPEIAAERLSFNSQMQRDYARPCALLLSPHPDDECLTAGLPLRLLQEQNWQIINLPVTLGSKISRRAARRLELAKACAVLGFDCSTFYCGEVKPITNETKTQDPENWEHQVDALAKTISFHYKPQAIFFPHANDAHLTHIGVHLLAMEALAKLGDSFSCSIFQTEFWHPHATPNLMIGIDEKDTTKILSALTCHVGEVARNPYDRRFPAYLIDNVRRGSERVGGKGVAAADMDFAVLYYYGLWRGGKFVPSALNRIIGTTDNVGALFD